MMKSKHPFLFYVLLPALLVLLLIGGAWLLFAPEAVVAIIDTKGLIAYEECKLLIISTLLMLIVVIPVFILLFFFIWRYRADNTKAKYTPDWDDNKVAECIWWGIPCLIILVLSVLTWQKTHELDPYRPIEGSKPLTVQVVALQWKWLFIYPEQQIASVNFLQIPEKVPVHFEITSDAPMNSFWIPELSGQIFAMPGMRTELHVIADKVGTFRGSSANLSGAGFAAMHFTTQATTQDEFDAWVRSAQRSAKQLDQSAYEQLAQPTEESQAITYQLKKGDLFDYVVMKSAMPAMK